MTETFTELHSFGREQLEATSAATANFAKAVQSIAAETTDYSKKVFEDQASYLEKLVGAKSFDSVLQIQSDYAKSAYESAIDQATRIGELYQGLVKEAVKPLETVIARATERK